MEKSESSLVPEWLRCTTSGATSPHHFALSSFKSDVPPPTPSMRERSSRSISDKDSTRSIFPDRSTSFNSRRHSISSGSTKHLYSSFSRSQRDKNRDKDKERSVIRDLWDYDYCDPLGNALAIRGENITLRRFQSMVSGRPGVVLPKRALESKKCSKTAFEKEFPSLGTEEKQGVHGMGRVSSPRLCTAVQSLPICNSGLIGGEAWTSALAEVPTVIGSHSMGTACVQQSVIATPTSGVSSAMVGLNMAEALSQATSHVRTTPQLPDKIQRLEDLAIKQSRQLIPMTHAIPKPLGLSSTDRSKHPKTSVKTGEINATAKSAQQQQQQQQQQPKTSHVGKFHVLKPLWENVVSAPLMGPPASLTVPHVPVLGPHAPMTGPEVPLTGTKASTPRSTGEKKPSFSQAKSRSDFFNLMRKKNNSVSSAVILSDSSCSDVWPPTSENSGSAIEEACDTENGSKMTGNGDFHEESQRFSDVEEKSSSGLNGAVYPNEEEAAFLRSLGWEEENTGDDEGLTEEEIDAFYQEYMKLRPSLKACRGAQPKFAILSESGVSNLGRPSSKSESIA